MATLGRDESYGANKIISPEEVEEKQKLRTEQLKNARLFKKSK